jgi:8-oxo-dGTP diphosphatase
MSDKAALRHRMKQLRASLDPQALAEAGAAVTRRVLELPMLASPTAVCCYVSVRRELPTGELLSELRARGHTLSVPRVVDRDHMEARLWQEPLVPAVLGIPTSDGPVVPDVAVAICPGLAFDRHGGRLGYGAGHYDRWLRSVPGIVPVGVVLDEGLFDQLPTLEHDVHMAYVITPTSTLEVATRKKIRVVGGAWLREGRVLAAKRGPGRARAGTWELPGGKVERGESDADALRRELREELGVEVQVGELIGSSVSEEPDATVELFAYVVSADGEPSPTEHAELRWLGPDTLRSVDWAPADVPLLSPLARRLG